MKLKKTSLFLLTTLLLTGCNKSNSTSTNSVNSNSSANSTKQSESINSNKNTDSTSKDSTSKSDNSNSKTPDPTESLTADMYADFKLGYSATFISNKIYTEGKPSSNKFETASTALKYKYAKYSYGNNNQFSQVGTTKYYWAVERDGKTMTDDVSLSFDNTIRHKAYTEKDLVTLDDFEVQWQYTYFANVLANFESTDFSKKDSNTFVLSSSKTKDYSDQLKTQFFSPYSTNLPSSDTNYFALKTDGDSIVGFELTCEAYTSSTTAMSFESSGTFTGKGLEAYKDITPVTGNDIPELQSILDELKTYNWNLTQTQSQYSLDTNSMNPLGTLKVTVGDNGNKEYWEYYNTSNKRTQSYGYMKYVDPDTGKESKLGVVKIGDNYYQDSYLYQGTMKEKMPSFNLSTKFFKKDEAASTDGKVVYKTDYSVELSDDNYASEFFSPENMRGYEDRLINITITKDGDKITIRNSTGSNGEDTGLIMNCEFTDIGSVTNFMDETTMKTNLDGLKWSDLISPNENNYSTIIGKYGKDNIDSLPLIDNQHANLYIDSDQSETILYFYFYNQTSMDTLFTEYKSKLETAGLEVDTTKTATDDSVYYLKKGITINGEKGRVYIADLNVNVYKIWNKSTSWGQFQLRLSLTNFRNA